MSWVMDLPHYVQGCINTKSIGGFMYMGPKWASLPGSVVQCWPGNVGVPSSNLGIDWFYAPPPTIQDEYPLSSIQNKQASKAPWFSACLVISGSRARIWVLIFEFRQHSEHLSKSLLLLSPGIKPGTHRVHDRFHGPPHSRPSFKAPVR